MPTSPGDVADPDRLLDAAVAVFYSSQVEHAHLMQHLAGAHDINPVDLRALNFLGAIDVNRTPKDLREYLQMGTGAVTALLDRLAKRGLLRRVSNPDDRRSVRIELTADGAAVVGAVRAAYRSALARSVPPEGFELFIGFSEVLTQSLRDAAQE